MAPRKFRWSIDAGANWNYEEQELPYNLAGVTAQQAVTVEPIGTAVTEGSIVLAPFRTVPDTPNRFYLVVRCDDGLIRKYRFQRNTGAAADTANLGVSWPEWRITGIGRMTGFGDDPAGDGRWLHDDAGASEFIANVSGKSFGSYHGVGAAGALLSETVKMDGVSFDPTAGTVTGNAFELRNDVTASDGTVSVNRDLTIALGTSGELRYTLNAVNVTGTISYIRLGMPISEYVGWTEGDLGVTADGSLTPLRLGPDEFVSRLYNGVGRIRMRNITNGDFIEVKCDANVVSAPGYAYSELFRQVVNQRCKAYGARFTSNYGSMNGLTWGMAIGQVAAGSAVLPTNLIANGDFASDVAGWVQAFGAVAPAWQAPGYLRQTRETGSSRVRPAGIATDTNTIYLLSADLVAVSAGSLPNIRASNSGSAALGGTVVSQTFVVGKNVIAFKAGNATTYVGAELSAGTAGQTADLDNFAFYAIAP